MAEQNGAVKNPPAEIFDPTKLHNLPARQADAPRATMEKYLDFYREYIIKALPKHMDPDKMIRALVSMTVKNPALLNCTFLSLMAAVLEASQLGLYIGHRAHVIPFKNVATLIPDYKGLIDLARNSALVADVYAHIVYEGEDFEINYGVPQCLHHIPLPPSERGEKRKGAYAVCIYKDGTSHFEWLWADEVVAIKAMAPGSRKKESPWNSPIPTVLDEMWKKTAVRRLAKYMPASSDLARFQRAADLDNEAEAGLAQHLEMDLPIEVRPEPDSIPAEVVAEDIDPDDAWDGFLVTAYPDQEEWPKESAASFRTFAEQTAEANGCTLPMLLDLARQDPEGFMEQWSKWFEGQKAQAPA